jgi:hypothetical protein
MIKKLQNKFPVLPEGEQLVCVKEVIDKDYAKFEKLTIVVENAEGVSCSMNFNFVKDDGTPNDGAEAAYTFMARALLHDANADEIDTDDLVGKFAIAEVTHTTGRKGGTFANVKKWTPTDGTFTTASAPTENAAPKKTAAEIIAEARARKAASAE